MDDKLQPGLLCLLAHPDDETFICGGTLAHYTKQGVRVKVVSATKGHMGRRMGNPPFITRETMPAVREGELREACRILGAEEPEFLGIRDKTVEYQDEEALAARLASIIRAFRPDTVLTFHPEWGGHPDHCAIGQAAVRAVRSLAGEDVFPSLYFITFGETFKHPERFGLSADDVVRVDVSDSQREKLLAFRAHRTQTEMDAWVWLPDEEALSKFGPHEYFIVSRDGSDQPGDAWFAAGSLSR